MHRECRQSDHSHTLRVHWHTPGKWYGGEEEELLIESITILSTFLSCRLCSIIYTCPAFVNASQLLLCALSAPQDMKLRQIVTMGSLDTLEQKTVTVCYGTDFVNVTFVNFCCTRKDIAQVSGN